MSQYKTQPKPIGPWPLGVNNVDDPKASPFQPEGRGAPQLTEARNVDLDREGWPRRRTGRTKRLDLTSAHSLFAAGERLLLVDDGTLYEVARDYSLTEVATGLGNHPLSYATLGDTIFYANEATTGVVGSFWGVAMPSSPILSATAGTMQPGRYLVAVTAVRGGIESGARQPSVGELSETGGFTLDVAGIDPDADALNVYCTEPNGQELYWVGEFPPASPITLDRTQVSTDPLTTLGHYPPPTGQHIALFRGRMLVAQGPVLYWSQPLAPHHFRVQTDAQLFADRIVMLAALDEGFFIADPMRTYWVQGADPHEWRPRLVDTRRVAEGRALRIPARKLPSLDAQGEVCLWATEDGFVAGLGDGSIRPLTDGRLATDAYKQAALAYREQDGLRQILMSLQTKDSETRFGATDRVTCRVIRANENVGEP